MGGGGIETSVIPSHYSVGDKKSGMIAWGRAQKRERVKRKATDSSWKTEREEVDKSLTTKGVSEAVMELVYQVRNGRTASDKKLLGDSEENASRKR